MLLITVVAMTAVLPAPLVVDRAEFIATPAAHDPPAKTAPWRAVTLPDRWQKRRPDLSGPAWYRFPVDRERFTSDLWGIYLPSVNMNAAVYVNGTRLGSGGDMGGEIANNWNCPLLFTFPRRLLDGGSNEVVVQVAARAFAFGGLGPVVVGPAEELTPIYERRQFLTVTLARVSSFIALLLCLWAAGTWLATRRDPVFGWFAVAMFWFAAGSLNYHVRDLPVSRPVWEWMVNVSIDAAAVAAMIFIHRLTGIRRPTVERWFVAIWACGAIVMAAVPSRHFYSVANIQHVWGATAAALSAWVAFRRVPTLGRFEAGSTLTGTLIAAALACHDLLIQLGLLDQASARLLPHAITMCVLTFGSILIARFARAFEAGRRHNAELKRAVQARELELEAQFDRVRGFEREQLLTAERARIMRDVHDGLGAHLASTLAMAEGPAFSREQVIEALRLIAEELSLLIDALDPTLDDLPSLLAILRGRIEPRLNRSGVRFEWRVSEVSPVAKLKPEHLHHCIRIVQESIANILKHARAHTIVVCTSVDDDGLVLEIRDDGVGLGPPRQHGRGLYNMEQRARQMGGRLTVASANPGTAVVLHLPFSVSPPASASLN